MGGCREVLRVKSGKGEEGVLEQKHSDLKNGEVKRKKRIRRGEKRKQKGVGGNCYWVWVTAPRARRGISVLEESFTGGNPKLPGHEEVIHGLCYVTAIVWMKLQNRKQWATSGGNWKLPDC